MRVAFQGEPGAYSHEALQHVFGADTPFVPCRDFQSLIDAVVEGRAPFGMLPVENSLAGTVGAAVDALLDADLEPVAEVVRPIRHCLLGVPGANPGEIRRVLSHPVALAQCLRFFRDRPEVDAVAVHDTAGAARMVADDGDPGVAALASASAAERYGLAVLARDLQDRDDNQTRFLVVRRPGGPDPDLPPGPLHSLLAFETDDRPGALVDVLLAFSRRGLNLSRLESRPGRLPWSYRFVAEVQADLHRGEGLDAVEEARSRTRTLDVRGPFTAMEGDRARTSSTAGGDRASVAAGVERVREAIDRLDGRLVHLLADRLRLAREAQALRDEGGSGGVDPLREARVVRRAAEVGREMGLSEEALRKVFRGVVTLCAPDDERREGGPGRAPASDER